MSKRIKASAVPVVAVFLGIFAALVLAEPDQWDADIAALASADRDARAAARGRIEAGGSASVSSLLTEIEDTAHSPLQKSEMVTAVLNIGPTDAQFTSAKDLLASADASVRRAGLQVLAAKPTTYRRTFLERMRDEDEVPSTRAASALLAGKGGADSRSQLLRVIRNAASPRVLVAGALRGLVLASADGAEDVASVVEDASEPAWKRQAALSALGEAGGHGSAELASLLTAPWPWVRAGSAGALGRLEETAQASNLALRLTDVVPEVRLAAIRALVMMGQADDKRTDIEKLVTDPNSLVAIAALQVVAEHSRDRATQMATKLKGILAHAEFHRRYHAALALHHMGDNAGVATMNGDKKSPNTMIADMATAAVNLMTNGQG